VTAEADNHNQHDQGKSDDEKENETAALPYNSGPGWPLPRILFLQYVHLSLLIQVKLFKTVRRPGFVSLVPVNRLFYAFAKQDNIKTAPVSLPLNSFAPRSAILRQKHAK